MVLCIDINKYQYIYICDYIDRVYASMYICSVHVYIALALYLYTHHRVYAHECVNAYINKRKNKGK